jgi:hypothetical protein
VSTFYRHESYFASVPSTFSISFFFFVLFLSPPAHLLDSGGRVVEGCEAGGGLGVDNARVAKVRHNEVNVPETTPLRSTQKLASAGAVPGESGMLHTFVVCRRPGMIRQNGSASGEKAGDNHAVCYSVRII